MRLFTSLVTLLTLYVSLAVSTPLLAPRKACDPNARGPLLRLRQEAAIKDFAEIFLIEKNPQKVFDKYIPGEYIQHNPDALSGRQPAIDFLKDLWSTPGIRFANISAWAGEGFGMMHYRMTAPDFDYAVMDRLRFKGTCFNEHWDVLQRIYGNETNPIAFF
ncbi:hypothetical protein CC2G_003585 [Coprinopsis cinerea AmutBmut pab1-1]|nr:hypothetical protein CC2G_003585 [Coprinopsis cinerea AmutBmut pab1-1]